MRFVTALAAPLAALLLAIQPAPAAEVQFFGQSALKITADDGRVIVIDPFITNNPLTPEEHKDLSKLGEVDLILVTHGHGDHIGDTPKLARMTDAKVGLNADMGHTFRTLGMVPADQLVRFNKGGTIQPIGEGISITMTHAEHSSEVVHENPETGAEQVYPGGEPAGYVIEIDGGPTIYHAGDTGVFGDMSFISEYYEPDVAFIPIGGHFTMDPAHAAHALMTYLNVTTAVPIHYATFPPLTGTPEQLRDHLDGYPVDVIVMQPGETRTF